MKRRSTSTTTVLAFLSLTPTPCSTRFGIVLFLFRPLLGGRFCFLGRRLLFLLRRFGFGFGRLRRRPLRRHLRMARPFTQDRLDARDVLAHVAHAVGLFQLAAGALEAQVELLLLQRGQLVFQLVAALIAEVGGCGHAFVLTTPAARRTASR